jgi:hypothetical protein
MIVSTQYPTAEVLDTQVRSQLELRFQCRVASKEQLKVIHGHSDDEVDLGLISPNQRGAFVLTGLEPKPLVARAAWIDDDLVAGRVDSTAHLAVPSSTLFASVDPVLEDPEPGLESVLEPEIDPVLEHGPTGEPAPVETASVPASASTTFLPTVGTVA